MQHSPTKETQSILGCLLWGDTKKGIVDVNSRFSDEYLYTTP